MGGRFASHLWFDSLCTLGMKCISSGVLLVQKGAPNCRFLWVSFQELRGDVWAFSAPGSNRDWALSTKTRIFEWLKFPPHAPDGQPQRCLVLSHAISIHIHRNPQEDYFGSHRFTQPFCLKWGPNSSFDCFSVSSVLSMSILWKNMKIAIQTSFGAVALETWNGMILCHHKHPFPLPSKNHFTSADKSCHVNTESWFIKYFST